MTEDIYETDFHAWCLHQSALLVDRAQRHPPLFSGLDVSRIAEEIEELANYERGAVARQLTVALEHLIMVSHLQDSPFERGWRSEIIAALQNARRTYTPSMRQKIILDQIWNDARMDALQELERDGIHERAVLSQCPVPFGALLDDAISSNELIHAFLVAVQLHLSVDPSKY